MNQRPKSCIYVHELNQVFIKQYFPLLHVIYYDFFFSKKIFLKEYLLDASEKRE